jgi:hypothetical protein
VRVGGPRRYRKRRCERCVDERYRARLPGALAALAEMRAQSARWKAQQRVRDWVQLCETLAPPGASNPYTGASRHEAEYHAVMSREVFSEGFEGFVQRASRSSDKDLAMDFTVHRPGSRRREARGAEAGEAPQANLTNARALVSAR